MIETMLGFGLRFGTVGRMGIMMGNQGGNVGVRIVGLLFAARTAYPQEQQDGKGKEEDESHEVFR